MNYEKAINDQYGQPDLITKILSLLQRMGTDTTALTRENFALFEEIHIQGRTATIELAREAGLSEGMRVLDVGCGIGGPARTLAAEFDCYVTGLDLNQEYCRAAEILTDLMGLNDKVTIHQGNALDMPFADATFDLVWTQHTLMNIEDKKRLFRQVHRVLRPRGRLALYEICAGSTTPAHFPVVWANTPAISFLLLPLELRQLIKGSGFMELVWIDDALKHIKSSQNRRFTQIPTQPRPFGADLVIGPDMTKKVANVRRNLEEERIVVIQGIFERTE